MGTICKRPQQQSIRSHRMTSIALNQGQLTTKVPATKLQVYTGGCTPITRYPTEGFSRIMLKKGFGVTNQLVVELGFGFRLSLWQRGTFFLSHTHTHTLAPFHHGCCCVSQERCSYFGLAPIRSQQLPVSLARALARSPDRVLLLEPAQLWP